MEETADQSYERVVTSTCQHSPYTKVWGSHNIINRLAHHLEDLKNVHRQVQTGSQKKAISNTGHMTVTIMRVDCQRPNALHYPQPANKMRNYYLLQKGNNPDPEELELMVFKGESEPKCFLTSRMNSARVIPFHGELWAALGQPDDLHGHAFVFVGKQKLGIGCLGTLLQWTMLTMLKTTP